MTQIISQNNWWWSGGWASYIAWTWIDITSNEISIDTDVVQTVGNMVDNLTWADDDHYPTAKAVADAISWGWLWDVIWPASSTDWDIVLFDWATGKIIKDSWVWLSSKLDASAMSNNNYGWAWSWDSTHTPTKWVLYDKIHTMDVEIGNKAADTSVVKLTWNQTINWTKTFWTSPVVPSKTTAATNSWTDIATEAQVKLVADDVATINGMISSNASSSNKLMDKNYIDDSINSVSAYYITKNAAGDQWATYAELAAATTFYSWWVQRTPTRNDYTIVLADENHDDATTRYIYQGNQWEYQYTVNETALTQSQLDALNSWITSGKVSAYDGYATTISGKQDALTLPATPTQWNLVVWGANNKTIADGWAIPTWFSPSNTWTAGQVLTKTAWGYEYADAPVTSVNGSTGAITWLATTSDLSWKQDKATSGSTAPSTTPSYVWEQYVDTTNDKLYVATGTSSSSDWMEVWAWWWEVWVSTQANNILTVWMKIWAGTQANYEALWTYDNQTVYLTI